MNVSILRFSNIFGPFSLHKSSSIHQIIKSNIKQSIFKIHGSGLQSRDFIYVNDLIKPISNLLNKTKTPLINCINSNKFTQLMQIIKIVDHISKKNTRYKYVKAPSGYDIKIKKNFSKPNKKLILNLKKTFNWYRSNYK